jgi:hypothetical protein
MTDPTLRDVLAGALDRCYGLGQSLVMARLADLPETATGWDAAAVRLIAALDPAIRERLEAALAYPDCTHHCEGGHFDGDDMTMNEQYGWSLRDRGLGLDGEPLEAGAVVVTVEGVARRLWDFLNDDEDYQWETIVSEHLRARHIERTRRILGLPDDSEAGHG